MAETNGFAEIKVGGVKYSLLFGRAAVQEMSDRSIEKPSANSVELLTNLIYSGMLNFNIKHDLPRVPYHEAYDLVEAFADESDAREQERLLWEIFESSRWGSKWMEELADIKKKVMEMAEQLAP